jgi:hypothetical protein
MYPQLSTTIKNKNNTELYTKNKENVESKKKTPPSMT